MITEFSFVGENNCETQEMLQFLYFLPYAISHNCNYLVIATVYFTK